MYRPVFPSLSYPTSKFVLDRNFPGSSGSSSVGRLLIVKILWASASPQNLEGAPERSNAVATPSNIVLRARSRVPNVRGEFFLLRVVRRFAHRKTHHLRRSEKFALVGLREPASPITLLE